MTDLTTLVFLAIERVCVECNRHFDLVNPDDAQDWYYGHDCEAD